MRNTKLKRGELHKISGRGQFLRTAVVDEQDLHLFTEYGFSDNGAGYLRSRAGYLHRLIMGAKTGQIVDHANRDTYDNRRCNLRFVTKSENALNSITRERLRQDIGRHHERHQESR